MRVPWTARRSNESILKEISPGCSLEGLMLKLKLQYFSHLMRRADSLEKTLMLGKIEGGRRREQDGWIASPTQWTSRLRPYPQFSSVALSCPTLCDSMDCSMLGFPVHHQLLELAQIHVHRVGDAIQPSHPLPSPPAFNLSQH